MRNKASISSELLPGTLEMLILKTLSRRAAHGYGIARHLEQVSADVLQVGESSLYPALQRLLVKGWIADAWGRTLENRRARYYRLTPSGRRHLERELARYHRVARAVARVLSPA